MDVFPSGAIHCQNSRRGLCFGLLFANVDLSHVEGARRRWYQPQ
jgi:hypothetical protein